MKRRTFIGLGLGLLVGGGAAVRRALEQPERTIRAPGGLRVPGRAAAETNPRDMFRRRVNRYRLDHGLPPVRMDAVLADYAHRHSVAMRRSGDIYHSTGTQLAGAMADRPWHAIGEIIGVGPDVRALFPAFVASPEHAAIIRGPDYTRIGIGIAVDERMWITAVFYG